MAGRPIERAARARRARLRRQHGRLRLAFARAVEAAHGIEVPPRAVWLRALMAELERLANHFGDIGAICNDAAFAMMHAQCGAAARAGAARGGRLFRPPADDGPRRARRGARSTSGGWRADLARWSRMSARISPSSSSSTTTPLRCRTAPSARASSRRQLARQFGAGGYVGRASGRAFDARRAPGLCALRRSCTFEVPVLRGRRRECARLDPHPRGRAEPGA